MCDECDWSLLLSFRICTKAIRIPRRELSSTQLIPLMYSNGEEGIFANNRTLDYLFVQSSGNNYTAIIEINAR
jgi:hypothetical protein